MVLSVATQNVALRAAAGRTCTCRLRPIINQKSVNHRGHGRGRLRTAESRHVAKGGNDNTDIAREASTSSPFRVNTDTLKASLLQTVFNTARGLEAKSADQGKINELINQLEVKGGQGADVSSIDFGGSWELLYTNAADLLALMSVSKLPLSPIKIGSITQTINSSSGTIESSVQLEFSLVQTSLSTVSNYNIASPKRLQFTVHRGILHTPSIEGNLELPASVTFMGQTLNLAPLWDALAPITRSAVSFAESALGQAPNLEVPLQTQTWQLTTYLDSSLRITRGDGGSVYILRKTATGPPTPYV